MNLIIIDDDPLVSSALKTILESQADITVCASGMDGTEAISLYRTHRPDILLMDIRMKHTSGLEATAEILKEFPDAKILLLTTFSDDEYIIQALKLGARGYLLKQDYGSILPALKTVLSGQTVFGSEIISKLPGLIRHTDDFDYAASEINDREREIITLRFGLGGAREQTQKEVADRLGISQSYISRLEKRIISRLKKEILKMS